MRVGVYFCNCGTNIAGKIDPEQVKTRLRDMPEVDYFETCGFLCSEDGKRFLAEDIRSREPDRVVIAACSPRDHEANFMRVLESAGLNPYLFQMANIREQVAWVTSDPERALSKGVGAIRSAIARVRLHEPLEKQKLDIVPDVLVIGAGPAGLKAALTLAAADRRVVLVEKDPVIGGKPVRYEELFPVMECAPCMLEPLMGNVFHGELADRVELLTQTEVVEVTGYYGNFIVKLRQQPRHVDPVQCIGCGECVAVCPANAPNEFNCGMSDRKAIDFPFAGALPYAPYLDHQTCIRDRGDDCRLCKDACPLGPDIIDLDAGELVKERNVGAIIVATGSGLYDCSALSGLGYGRLPDVYTSYEFERILSSTGPTGGELVTKEGKLPGSVAIIHCVGSLDEAYQPYCSGVCCQYAFKYDHLLRSRLPDIRITHLYRHLVLPGKDGTSLYREAVTSHAVDLIRYENISDISLCTCNSGNGGTIISLGQQDKLNADLVILCPAITAAPGADTLAEVLDVSRDRWGFFEELHGRLDAAQSKLKGVYLAGTCQAPMDIQQAMQQGMAAAGYVLAGLVPGRKLEIEPITAAVQTDRCGGCRVCIAVCPYKATGFDEESRKSAVNPVLCHGCGTCVAACPAGAMEGHHFTSAEITAELEAALG